MGLAALRAAAAPPPPNIILILADDLGHECLGCYGGTSYKTPNLDHLAATGLKFDHAYAQPLCAPTRLQLMTGQYNFRNWEAFGILNPKEKTFGHFMREAGYSTCIAGKWQLYSYNPPDYEPEWRGRGMHPKDSGFEEYCVWHALHTEDKGSRYADPTVLQNGELRKDIKGAYGEDIFCDFIGNFMQRNRQKSFFVYYPMVLTHGPFNATPISAEWKTGPRLKNDPRNYGDMVEYMDQVVGRIVAKVDALGLRERTLILFYSDNGTPREIRSKKGNTVIEGGKGLTTDAGTHVPLIANWKGTTKPGKVNHDLVDSTDFIPTIMAAAGHRLRAGKKVDGQSFFPQIRGEKGTPRNWIFCHYDPRPGWDKKQYQLQRFARDQRWKLYDDGRLYDLEADVVEKHPIKSGEGGSAAGVARAKLQPVLKSFQT